MPRPSPPADPDTAVRGGRALAIAVTGAAAGLFSGLFGVGGGTILVPLLVLWLRYDERTAAGTSLAVIAAISIVGVIAQTIYGNVDVGDAALVGLPATVGVLAGIWLQGRIATDTVGLLFAIVLTAAAVEVIVR